MASQHSPAFDYVYGFDLLDEVHNFFPEFLYDDELFDNDIAGFFRYRVAALFPRAYVRHQHMYNLYNRENSRAAFGDYMRLRHGSATAAVAPPPPPQFPPSPLQVPPESDVDQSPHTTRPSSPPDISGSQPLIVPAQRTPRRTAPLLQTPPPPRRRINTERTDPFVGSTGTSRISQVLFDSPNTTTVTAEFVQDQLGGLRLMDFLFGNVWGTTNTNIQWSDVVVAPTGAQIETASELQTNPSADSVCSICQEGIGTAAEDDTGRLDTTWRVLRCGHAFHRPCIDTWLQNHVRCPMCRRDVRTMSAPSTITSTAAMPSTIASTAAMPSTIASTAAMPSTIASTAAMPSTIASTAAMPSTITSTAATSTIRTTTPSMWTSTLRGQPMS